MGYFDDLFSGEFLLDSEYKQRSDIEGLKQAIVDAPDPSRLVRPLVQRIDRLELLCKALTELIVSKGLATKEELSVVSQQLDLEDGIEDGKISSRVHKKAPRCSNCARFVNPRREHCVYCNARMGKADAPAPTARTVNCSGCGNEVPESDSYYTGRGLQCQACFDAYSS